MLIDAVKQGESILILDRDVPVARLETAFASSVNQEMDTHLAQLERTGQFSRKKKDLPDDFFQYPRVSLKENVSIVDAVQRDREEGR